VEKDEERELALRGKRCFGFVEEEEAVALELEFEEREKGFSVGTVVETDASVELLQ
jgi:hypothetical protein